jgi:hypothetical protein
MAKMNAKIIAVDFDGCLVRDKFPDIGELIPETVTALLEEQAKGSRIILWTCRRGAQRLAAVKWCEEHGIKLDAVNENLPELTEFFGEDTRKIFANEYWDDRARQMPSDGNGIEEIIAIMRNARRNMWYLVSKGRSEDYPRGVFDALRWVLGDDTEGEINSWTADYSNTNVEFPPLPSCGPYSFLNVCNAGGGVRCVHQRETTGGFSCAAFA